MSAPYLTIVSGIRSGARLPIPSGGLVVGRGVDPAGRLAGDEALSRRHARFLTTASGRVLVEDLGSTNGTYVNDVRLADAIVLRDGDIIRVGDTFLEFFGDSQTQEHQPAARTGAQGGVAIGGSVHARGGSLGAVGELHGNVDLSRRAVTAYPGGHAAGGHIYHSQRYEYDASGLGLLTRARGAARFVLILGTLIGFVGFGLFGYPIVKGIVNAASNTSAADAASRDCEDRFPDRGPAFVECQFDARQSSGGDFPSLTPWLPLGAALFFAGMAISVVGFFMIRHEP